MALNKDDEEEDDFTNGYELTDLCGFRDLDIKEFADSFKLSDIVGDGIMIAAELPRILCRLGELPREKEFQRILNDVDPEAKGLFTFQQFVRLMTYFDRHIITEEEITEAFKVFDQDGSGSIAAGELRHVLQTMGDRMTEEEANDMIAEADRDGDGEVDYGEFVKTILSSV
eukprot:GEMP01089127.1.p1 GENE.GEMP01089127.1~~GEMP01089127.1.p1  ORF type:complete len:171 (+),score=48.59 GEMP01089127.1:123-635(+)